MLTQYGVTTLDIVIRQHLFLLFGLAFALSGWWLYDTVPGVIVFGVGWVVASIVLTPVWTLVVGTRPGFSVFPEKPMLVGPTGRPFTLATEWVLAVLVLRVVWEFAAIALAGGLVWVARRERWAWVSRAALALLSLVIGVLCSAVGVGSVAAVLQDGIGVSGQRESLLTIGSVILIVGGTAAAVWLTWRWHTRPAVQILVTAFGGAFYLWASVPQASRVGTWLFVGGLSAGFSIQSVWYARATESGWLYSRASG